MSEREELAELRCAYARAVNAFNSCPSKYPLLREERQEEMYGLWIAVNAMEHIVGNQADGLSPFPKIEPLNTPLAKPPAA